MPSPRSLSGISGELASQAAVPHLLLTGSELRGSMFAAMEILRKDVVVVGLGGFGSAALWRLAERGVDVAGIERQGIGHHLGSSHGATRLFRIACQEHPGLAAVALKSLELWTGLGEQTGQQLVRQSGCLTTGSASSGPLRGAIAAGEAGGVPG